MDLPAGGDADFDRLVDLGALDAERLEGGGLAALMPDSTTPDQVARALGVSRVSTSPALERDAGSVWLLRPRPVLAGRLRIVPADLDAHPGDLRLVDAAAFGTGVHPTTALCLDALDDVLHPDPPAAMLDIGTGSGVLALAALRLGVRRALGIDIDGGALAVAAENARINGLDDRLDLACGGPETTAGTWPLVVANVLAAPLIEMAPALARRLGHDGLVILSGISAGMTPDVARAYEHSGMVRVRAAARAGWAVLVLRASW